MSKHTKRQAITAICYDAKGKVLSLGRNSYVKTHPLQAKIAAQVGEPSRIFLHAEFDAIIKAREWDKIHKLAIFRFNKLGQPLNAAPCRICQRLIKLAGIGNVVYTTEER